MTIAIHYVPSQGGDHQELLPSARMNYDDPIFKVPALPAKRKAQSDPPAPYKTAKQPRVDDPDPDGLDIEPTIADLEQEENEPDEEGGRFHGSGVSSAQREILSYFDREDGMPSDGEVIGQEGFSDRDVKKLAAALEKAASVNESRRSKFVNDPKKYGILFLSCGLKCVGILILRQIYLLRLRRFRF
jgi:hypothetical protein